MRPMERLRRPSMTLIAVLALLVLPMWTSGLREVQAAANFASERPAPLMTIVSYNITLSGANEVSATGVPNQGDLDGSGTAALSFDTTLNQICYTLEVAGIVLPAAAAHIHRGQAGVNGPVVVPFTAPNASGDSNACAVIDVTLFNEILATPANFYVNVHTSDKPAGAVRGQLTGSIYNIALSGANEVDGNGVPNQGDPDGTGTAWITVDPVHDDVCYALRTSNIVLPATAAHIHVSPPGLSGAIVITLGTPAADGTATGCTTNATTLLDNIVATPANYYVNVHTSDKPAGAVRGQLAGKSYSTVLSGANEVDANGLPNQGDADGTGSAWITVDTVSRDVCYVLRTNSIALPASAAHIHNALPGLNGAIVVTLGTPAANGTATGCTTVTQATANKIAAAPINYYVNVHTSEKPGGAVRGQLVGTSFRMTLSGANEVDANGAPNQGDPDGTGSAWITIDAVPGQICWVLRASAITLPASLAHIHRSPAGLNGAIVVNLTPPDASGLASGCRSSSTAMLNAILALPANYYVNIHNADFPSGALRGQLAGTTLRATLTGAEVVSATGGDPDGSGTAVISLDAVHSQLCFVLRAANITLPASAARIKQAPAGSNGPAVSMIKAPVASGLSSGCKVETATLINQILATPADYFVTIMTSDKPNGALRGQLAP